MDVKDKKILYELSKNGRISLTQLAKNIKTSQSTTHYKLERLRKDGILVSTFTIINAYMLGYLGFRAWLSLNNCTPDTEREIKKWITNREEVSVFGNMEESNKFVIMSWVKSTERFYRFVRELKETYGEFIESFHISSYIGTTYYPRNYLSKNLSSSKITVRNFQKVETDEIDIAILKSIAYDARKSSLEIGKNIGKTAKTVINRIKSLEKKGIIAGYGANIDVEKMGRTYYKLNVIFTKSVKFEKLLELVNTIPETIYVDESISNYDLELNVEVESKERFANIIEDLKKATGGIKSIEIKKHGKYLKLGLLS